MRQCLRNQRFCQSKTTMPLGDAEQPDRSETGVHGQRDVPGRFAVALDGPGEVLGEVAFEPALEQIFAAGSGEARILEEARIGVGRAGSVDQR